MILVKPGDLVKPIRDTMILGTVLKKGLYHINVYTTNIFIVVAVEQSFQKKNQYWIPGEPRGNWFDHRVEKNIDLDVIVLTHDGCCFSNHWDWIVI